jgi:phytoene dehydrogenase-like protein
MDTITIIGGGVAGLTAAISAAEEGAPVHLLEAHNELGGRARSMSGPYKANLGPHALLSSSPFWRWLGERGLLPPYARPRLSGVRFRWDDEIRRVPSVGATVAALRLRTRYAALELGFAVLLICAVIWFERRLVLTTGGAFLGAALPRLAYHLTTTDRLSTADNAGSLGSFVLELALAVLVMASVARAPRTETCTAFGRNAVL